VELNSIYNRGIVVNIQMHKVNTTLNMLGASEDKDQLVAGYIAPS
jgi:hypothetical protein